MRYVDAFPIDMEGKRLIYLRDPEGFSDQGVAVPPHVFQLLTLFDGERTLSEIPGAFALQFGGMGVTEDQVEALATQMDEVLLLDSDRFRRHREGVEEAFRLQPVRPAAHAGASYPEDPGELRTLIDGFFDASDGPGRPNPLPSGQPLKGLIAPHIDFNRGGPSFAWAYRALADSPPPDLFVVLGTGHAARAPFVMSMKDFETPLGLLRTNKAFVSRVAEDVEEDLFVDEACHRSEHSIEFQAVFLKYLYPDRDVAIVPILCGSFHGLVARGESPASHPHIGVFLKALRSAVSEHGGRVCIVAGVDLSHVGPRFGDPEALTGADIEDALAHDRQVLSAAVRLDPEGMYDTVTRAGDRTRICGTSSIYTLLHGMEAETARELRHDRVVDDGGQSMVSFASVAFH